MLRSLLAYVVHHHSIAIAAVFALFTCLIIYCGDVGSAEVRLREAVSSPTASPTSPPTTDSVEHPFAPIPAARTATVAFVTLTATDLELLQGGFSMAENAVWTSEMCAAVAQRWQRHFPIAHATLIRTPSAPFKSAWMLRAISCFRTLCVDCFFIPVPERQSLFDAEYHGEGELPNWLRWPYETLSFCSAGQQNSDLDVFLWDAVPWLIPASASTAASAAVRARRGASQRCGAVALITPTAMADFANLTHRGRHAGEYTTQELRAEAEAALAWQASRIDPPFAEPSLPSSSMDKAAARSVRGAATYRVLATQLSSYLADGRGYPPRFVLYVAWCNVARSYAFEAAAEDVKEGDAQLEVYVLCVRENEVVEVTSALRTFQRIKSTSV